MNDRWEIAVLHCFFGECERVEGELTVAGLNLTAAFGLAKEVGAGSESELGREVAKLRVALAGSASASVA